MKAFCLIMSSSASSDHSPPTAAKQYFEAGLAFFNERKFLDAEKQFMNALLLAPNRLSILINLSATLIELGKWPECQKICQKIIAMDPKNYDGLMNLSICLSHDNLHPKAVEYLDQAIKINPSMPHAWVNKGNIALDLHDFEGAADYFSQALNIDPQVPEIYIGRGNLRNELKEYQLALEDFDMALTLNPTNAYAKWNKALSLLRLGDFSNGWALFESRWQVPGIREHIKHHDIPLWLGRESLRDKTILISSEQGLGDTIQFSRYLQLIEALGANIIFEVPQSLVKLMGSISPSIKIVTNYSVDLHHPVDFHCPIMSLALAFKTAVNTIPNQLPYLFANENKRSYWHEKIAALSRQNGLSETPLRVGLAWSGSGRYAGKENFKRNMSITEVGKLILSFKDQPIEFHSLQIEADINQSFLELGSKNIFAHNKNLKDFSDTAALMMELDLVISIDTAAGHLAGALNLPTLLLIPDPPDFMAMTKINRSPWYPLTTLLRQEEVSCWSRPIAIAKKIIASMHEGAKH